MEKAKLSLSLLLPDMPDGDACAAQLPKALAGVRGVEEAHLTRVNGNATLCLHFDPNLLPLSRVERLAHQVGAEISSRYRHEEIPVAGLDTADRADTVAEALQALPGMLHATVNYAAGLAFVAYDSQQLDRKQIETTLRSWGVRPLEPSLDGKATRSAEGEDHSSHDHGSAPAFLPHWMQDRWPLLLVVASGLFLAAGFFGETFFGLANALARVFYILAYVTGGYDVATHALPGLLRGRFDTDVLMLAAAAGAAVLGEWAEGAFLLFLFALGHAGEHFALDRARNAINALAALMPKTALVKEGDQMRQVPVEAVQIGQTVLVRPGDRSPVDGMVIAGASAVDQSPVTGESVPVEKGPNDEIFAGSINLDAVLEVRVTKRAQDNTLSRVIQMVQEAQSQQSPTQQFTQRFTRRFVPAVLGLTALVILLPPLLGWMSWSASLYRGMLLLVAASPCALAIGAPAAVLAGIAQAARNGVLIKGGVHLENLGSLAVMAFDKTGTITKGAFEVTSIRPVDPVDESELLRMAAAIEQQSNHPLAAAVVRAARARGLDLPGPEQVQNIPGRGLIGQVNGARVWIGSARLFQAPDAPDLEPAIRTLVKELEDAGETTMIVYADGRWLGVLGLADQVRPTAATVMQRLRTLGVQHLVMLTGDNQTVAERVADQVGLTDVRAQLTPEQKLDAVKELIGTYGPLAMVGDGVNDAPALAQATVGVAMGGAGTAVALETADVALMADDLTKLPFAVGVSRASRRIIRQNLVVSLGVIGLLVFASVFGVVALSSAVILHEGSTLIVVANALRLLTFAEKNEP